MAMRFMLINKIYIVKKTYTIDNINFNKNKKKNFINYLYLIHRANFYLFYFVNYY